MLKNVNILYYILYIILYYIIIILYYNIIYNIYIYQSGWLVRPWMLKIYKSLNKAQRKKFAEASKRLQVTKKSADANGKVRVSAT